MLNFEIKKSNENSYRCASTGRTVLAIDCGHVRVFTRGFGNRSSKDILGE